MDQGHPPHHLPDLVGLEVADEVDVRPGVGVGLQVGGELLHPVLPAQADSGGNGGADSAVRLYLGSGAQGNLSRVPTRRPGGGGDFFLHCFDVLGQIHNISSFSTEIKPFPWHAVLSSPPPAFRPEGWCRG